MEFLQNWRPRQLARRWRFRWRTWGELNWLICVRQCIARQRHAGKRLRLSPTTRISMCGRPPSSETRNCYWPGGKMDVEGLHEDGFTEHFGGDSMQGKKRERWIELCELAAKEQDPVKLLSLVEEINRLLDERDQELTEQ